MNIYAPSNEEYARIFGGLSKYDIGLFARRLAKEMPEIRYAIEKESGTHPIIDLFVLKVHRDDVKRASPTLEEIKEIISPKLSRLDRIEIEVTCSIRQKSLMAVQASF